MKEGWEIKKFIEVCELIGGSQPPKGDFIYEPKEGYIRLIQVRDYRNDKYITYIPREKAKRFCSKDDIMIGRYGPPIFGIFKGLEGAYNVALMKAVVNEDICDKDYFYLFLQTDEIRKFVEHSSKRAAGQDGVRKELLDKYPVPLPKSLPEQQQIVSILDEAFAAIDQAKENLQRNLQNAKELFQSELNSIFTNKGEGWVEKKLGECFKLSSGYMLTAKMMKKGKYPVYGGNGISGFHSEFNLSGSNVIIGRVGALCGNVRNINEEIWLTDNAFQVTDFNYDFDNAFLTYLLNYKDLRSLARQSAQPVISNSSLKDLLLQFPISLKVQQKIVQQLDALSLQTKQLEANYQQQLNNLEDLKKSVLQKAFSGQLSESGFAGLKDKQDKDKKVINKNKKIK